MLQLLLVHANQPLIDQVFGTLRPPNWILRDVADSAYVACVPQRFTYLLGRITDKEWQERAVIYGVNALFDAKRTECLDPLLTALGEGSFLSTDLEGIAIRQAFWSGSCLNDDSVLLVRRFSDHPAITSWYYSSALYSLYDIMGWTNKHFYWFLAKADRHDLQAVKGNDNFYWKGREFCNAVNQALQKTVSPETRYERGRRGRVAMINGTLESVIPTDLLTLIMDYYFSDDIALTDLLA